MMPAPVSEAGLVTTRRPVPALCHRVILRDPSGRLWTPIIVARNGLEAEARAVALFDGYTAIGSAAMHPDEAHSHVGRPNDRIAFAGLVERRATWSASNVLVTVNVEPVDG